MIEKFLDTLPPKMGLEEISVVEVETYISYRATSVSPAAIQRELRHLDRFWRYLIEVLELSLYNPFKPFLVEPTRRPKNKFSLLTLDEFRRLIDAMGGIRPWSY
jgi:site-specific recombinase XerD